MVKLCKINCVLRITDNEKEYIYIYIYSVRGKKDKEAFRILGRVHCQKGFDVYVSLNHRSKNLETNSFVRQLCV